MLHFLGGPAVEWPAVEEEFPYNDAQGPPITRPGVTQPTDNLGRHVRHTPRDARVQPALRVMNCNVEVCDVRVPHGVEEDVVRFQVAAGG